MISLSVKIFAEVNFSNSLLVYLEKVNSWKFSPDPLIAKISSNEI